MSRQSRRRAAAATRVSDAVPVTDVRPVNDGLQNFQARLGLGTDNLLSAGRYNQSAPVTRDPRQLEAMYRQSWIVGAAVDAVADDMTRAGVDFGSAVAPDVVEAMNGQADDLKLWDSVGDTIRWARLYGGAIGVLLIDGQDTATPLRPETVKQDAFRGILPIGRWELIPDGVYGIGPGITDLGPGLGMQEFYRVGPNAPALRNAEIHHSRVIRMEGVKLPYFQRVTEQGWGLSIIERLLDRLLAFDSASVGAAQLVFKAYLRTLKVKGLRQILAAGGAAEEALAKNVEAIRRFQTTEGLSIIDADDDFQTHAYTFAGLDDVLLQFGQQLAGATGIPLVRLFGQSPAGLNSTGDGDIRNYYDGINARQQRDLRSPLNRVFDVLHRSTTGDRPPKGFGYNFNPLWQQSEKEKADTAQTITTAVVGAYDAGILSKPAALKELKQSADVTGVFSNISVADITDAENEGPLLGEMGLGGDDLLTPPEPEPDAVAPAPDGL